MYDAVIIGSGPGGYHCAKILAELGGKAAVVEKDKIGGCCTNYGCIPTKTLHASASFFTDIKNAQRYGINASASIDFKAVMERKEKVVNTMSRGIRKLLDDHNVEVVIGEAKIKDKNTVVVSGKELSARNIVIATGAKPRMLPGITKNDIVVTSTEILELKELPASLVVIGGGYVGCEFASIFSGFETKVTIIEMTQSLVPTEDADISAELLMAMRRQGVEVFTDSKIKKIEGNKVVFEKDNSENTIDADKILVSIGVVPYFDKAEMDKLGVKYGNGIIVNKKMQTSISNVYAVGDVTDQLKLAHYAYAQAEVAAKNIMGHDAAFDEAVVPSAIFTIPEVASVGVRNAQLNSSTFLFATSGKARAMDKPEGFVKIYHEDGYLKGFCAIGAHVSDLVSEATLAIKNNIPLKKIKETIHTHPTLSEVFLGAVEMALKG